MVQLFKPLGTVRVNFANEGRMVRNETQMRDQWRNLLKTLLLLSQGIKYLHTV